MGSRLCEDDGTRDGLHEPSLRLRTPVRFATANAGPVPGARGFKTHSMNDALEGPPILSAIKTSGVEVVVSVPDIVTSEGLLRPISTDPDLRHVRVCKEDEGVSICAALSYCGVRALLMMQQTGMYDSMNAIRAIAAGYGLPVCMLIGLQGAEAGEDPRNSDKHIVRCALPALEAVGVGHLLLRRSGDVAAVAPAIEDAYRRSRPVALFVGAMLAGA